MRHEWTHLEVGGFAADDVDFAALLAASDQSVKDDFDSKIMSPLMNAPDGAILLVTGYDDRIDTGEDHRTCLEREQKSSSDRASSAVDAVLAMIGRDWLDPPPSDWDALPQIGLIYQGRGALGLLEDGVDEEAQRRNRRVAFGVCRFLADE